MKRKIFSVFCIAAISLCLAACGQNESSEKQESSQTKTTVEATEAVTENTQTSSTKSGEVDLAALHGIKGDDDFAGSWKITIGTGAQLESFTYCFDGAGACYMGIGNMGTLSTYSLTNKDGQDIFTAHLVFGIEGDYTYNFSDDGNVLELTSTDGTKSSVLEKVSDYNPIPEAEKSPETDENLLGAWADDNGGYLYFGEDGIMYQSQIGATFTFSNYSASNGSLTSTYATNEAETETAEYSFDGETLTFNGYPYQRISAEELK